ARTSTGPASAKRRRSGSSCAICSTARSADRPASSSCRRWRPAGPRPTSCATSGRRLTAPASTGRSGVMTLNAIENVLSQPAAQATAWALLQFVWQGAAVGALTAVALTALRHSASDVRYVVASIGLALMLTLPVVSGVQRFQALRADEAAQPAAAATDAAGRGSARARVTGADAVDRHPAAASSY